MCPFPFSLILSGMENLLGGDGNGNPLQRPCQENTMDREAWQATVHRVAKLDTTE